MASRLVLVAHAPTAGTRELTFGDQSDLAHPELVEPESGRVASWASGPEPACQQTATRMGGTPQVLRALAGPDFGAWAGRSLAAVMAEDPEGLRAWMSDPSAAPYGGESLAGLIERVGSYCDERPWPPGRSLVVVAPLVARALAVHALGVAPEAIFRLDLAPLGRVGLSRHGAAWRLQQLG